MSNQAIFYMMGITGAIFVLIIFAYIILQKHLNKGDVKRIRQLREGTVASNFSSDIIYQKLYTIFNKIPILKRYLHKTRRKLEIIHIQDEYHTRRQAAHVILKLVIIVFILTIAILVLTKGETLLRVILLFFEAFLVETFMTGMIDKLDTKLLKQQIDFFAEIRHAYHEYNMVEEAIYETSQNDELEVSRQGEKIYEILISDDPETELEKYYDIAPNSYLKEFAGISYLTKEFGDRTVDGASLYLKNLNNITEEMQLEILKRDKLDYVFQSLSIISMIPVLGITPLKNWAVGNFSFTQSFYDGKAGLIVQILLIVLTFICYILTRKLKDTGSVRDEYVDQEKVWQMRLYKKPTVKKVVDMFLPKKDSIETRKITKMLKEAAAKQKIETLYVNKLLICIATFFLSFIFFILAHKVAVDYVYTQPTTDYSVMQELEGKELEAAQELTEMDNQVINYFKKGSLGFGGSTITQQLVKNITGERQYSKERKIQEIIWAQDIETKLTKTEIIELYMNVINLSHGCTGVQAAANTYFSKDVSELTLGECASIVAIANNPSYYDPVNHPENNVQRRNLILSQMLEQGYIDETEYDEAHNAELILDMSWSEREERALSHRSGRGSVASVTGTSSRWNTGGSRSAQRSVSASSTAATAAA